MKQKLKQFWKQNKLLIAILLFTIALLPYLYTLSYTKNELYKNIEPSKNRAIHSEERDVINKNNEESTEEYVEKNSTVQEQAIFIPQSEPHPQNAQPVSPPPAIAPTDSTTSTATNTEKNELPNAATLTVHGKTHTASVHEEDGTVYEFMNALTRVSDFTFSGKDFGAGLGYFVESINGIKNDRKKGRYWIFYKNGQKAKQGISQTPIHVGDNITWSYEDEIN